LIDPSAAATGEIVFDLISCLENRTGRRLQDEITETLLMTATFRIPALVYSNTTARTPRQPPA
jgi:hypothetical protein